MPEHRRTSSCLSSGSIQSPHTQTSTHRPAAQLFSPSPKSGRNVDLDISSRIIHSHPLSLLTLTHSPSNLSMTTARTCPPKILTHTHYHGQLSYTTSESFYSHTDNVPTMYRPNFPNPHTTKTTRPLTSSPPHMACMRLSFLAHTRRRSSICERQQRGPLPSSSPFPEKPKHQRTKDETRPFHHPTHRSPEQTTKHSSNFHTRRDHHHTHSREAFSPHSNRAHRSRSHSQLLPSRRRRRQPIRAISRVPPLR